MLPREYSTDLPNQRPNPIQVFSFYFSISSPGKEHICTKSTRESNLLEAALKYENTADKIAASVLKSKQEHSFKLVQNASLHMAVQIVGHREAKEVKETLLTHEYMLKVKSSMGISGRATISLAKDLRSARKNSKLVQPGMKHALKEHIHKLDGVFTVKKLGESVIPVVFCNDIEECLNIKQQERGIAIENSDLKIGLDAVRGEDFSRYASMY